MYMYSQCHGLTHACKLQLNFSCMLQNHTRAIGCARGAWAPCVPFQDNLECNSGLNFKADCTRNSETHRALSVIDYVALDRFSDFKPSMQSVFKLCRTGRTV